MVHDATRKFRLSADLDAAFAAACEAESVGPSATLRKLVIEWTRTVVESGDAPMTRGTVANPGAGGRSDGGP